MSEPLEVEERARLRGLVGWDNQDARDELIAAAPALLDEVDRLTEALEAATEKAKWWERTCDYWNTAAREAQGMRDMNAARAERAEADLAAMTGFRDECERQYQTAIHAQGQAEADLADEKRRHTGLRAGVEALAERWEGAYNSGCITGDYSHDMATASTYRECEHSLRALLDTATEEGL